MKIAMTLLGFLLKIVLICVYICTRGAELILTAFNTATQKLLEK